MSSEAVAVAPQERGWGKLLLALAAFLLFPIVPQLRVLAPIEQTSVLLVPALAACAVAGWWAGGSAWLAVVWTAFAGWILHAVAPSGGGFADLSRGWALLAASAFGIMCVVDQRRRFLPRALAALAVALGLGLLVTLIADAPPARVERMVQEQLTARSNLAIAQLYQGLQQLGIAGGAESGPGGAAFFAGVVGEAARVVGVLPRLAAPLFPALLALESLAALALAWALYHRFSRTRLGLPLGRLREFRFNDQLIWGLIVGLATLLPTMVALRVFGVNLLVFFGALFALRGLGVLLWFAVSGPIAAALLAAMAVVLLPVLLFVGLGLGIGDAWLDWRNLGRAPTRSNS